MFQGTSLRGMLLNAYGWWQMGQIALIAAIVTFVLAGVHPAAVGLRPLALPPGARGGGDPPVRRRHAHRPQAGPQPLVRALAPRSLRPGAPVW